MKRVQQPPRIILADDDEDPLTSSTTSTIASRPRPQAPSGLEQPGLAAHPSQTPLPPQTQTSQHQPQPPPQQLQPQPQPHPQPMNGANMNGGNMPGPVVGYPTPAGHQAELNYIYGMVEELSRQRARSQSLGNEDLIHSAADQVRAQEPNLDHYISVVEEALEKAKFSRDANAALLSQYATVIASMLKQFHEYKAKHVGDVASWHRSYRAQLAEARAENSRLREQIWEMQAHAGRANDLLRRFRAAYDDDEARWERRVDDRARRQELRFWKRMAMPTLPDDDPYWSDDDDLIDTAEKRRLTEMARALVEQQAELAALKAGAAGGGLEGGGPGGGEQQGGGGGESMPPQGQGTRTGALPFFPPSLLGGVPMQRGDPGPNMPIPPPRPSSAASSTGSTGQ
ncbi:hypothetical protein QBC39DRAFT_423330 [Podospora conica]|nr:hypothetical protein QBC39DRAFT_423330 [Schizothecium conicum]